jgi:outer membrane protein OmpA-like peptidoglycan-associated protein
MIKTSDVALNKATELAVAVYQGKGGLTPKEWAALYKGVKHRNKLGYDVQFGGSRVWNNADTLEYYGLNGGANLYAAVYEQYGAMVADLAPSVIKKLQPVGEILELDGLLKAKELLGANVGKADKVTFTEGAVTEVVGNANYSINFEINSDKVRGDSMPTIQQIYRQLATGSLKADIVGHTDNTGSADLNRDLSRRRAESVRREILTIARGSIADVRLNASGVGPDKPLDPGADQNSTSERAKNRRVEITLGR